MNRGAKHLWGDAKGKPVRLNRALVEAAAVITDAEHARLSVERNRLDAYQRESDPLYFEWQAGEGSKSAWLAKRLDIKSRFSY